MKGKNRETSIQNKCRKVAAQCGVTLFRNTVGTAITKNGGYITFGLGVGTSDLIGFVPVTITQQMVGKKLAVFTAIEIKTAGNKPNDAQQRFIDFVSGHGGLSTYVTSDAELQQLLLKFMKSL